MVSNDSPTHATIHIVHNTTAIPITVIKLCNNNNNNNNSTD